MLRVCTPGDYKPFSLAKPDGTFEGLDIDLARSTAKALGVKAEFVKTTWPKLMDDFVEKCDIARRRHLRHADRQKRAVLQRRAYMVNGKAPITKCENVSKFQTVADIDKPDGHGHHQPRRQQRAVRARQLQAGEDRRSSTTT